MKLKLTFTLLALTCWAVVNCSASSYTSYTSVLGGVPVASFDNLPDGTLVDTQYPGLTFTQNGGPWYPNGGRPMINVYPWLFGYGSSSGSGVLTGSTESGAPFPTVEGIVIQFSNLQSSVEVFLSDTAPLGDYPVTAFDTNGNVLSAITVLGSMILPPGYTGCGDPIFPPPGCTPLPGIYVGFMDTSADIASIQIGPSTASGDAFAIDDVRVGSVPEPSSLLLVGSGILGAFGLLRRKLMP